MDTYHQLITVFANIDDPDEMETFFREIFTPKELTDLTMRWQLLKELYEGSPQRTIAKAHRISLCKITRGSKVLKQSYSVTRNMLDKYYGGTNRNDGT